MKNGIYTAATHDQVPKQLFIVCDNLMKEYDVSWFGDLGMWELWKSSGEPIDVTAYEDSEYPEMIADAINVHWDEVYVDAYDYDFDHLPETKEELLEIVDWWEETFDM